MTTTNSNKFIQIDEMKQCVSDFIEIKNADLFQCKIKTTVFYRKIDVLTYEDIPKSFSTRVFDRLFLPLRKLFKKLFPDPEIIVVVLRLKPIYGTVKEPKEYAFPIKIIDKKIKSHEVIKIKKQMLHLINKVSKKALNKTPEKICETTKLDVVRYVFSEKYNYKNRSNGINIKAVSILVMAILLLIFIILTLPI
ncbi:MAG: hypothetical protein J6A95_03570 [Clostridia bacterium]|nr:hypothetical protein [Clostridia bacterium]